MMARTEILKAWEDSKKQSSPANAVKITTGLIGDGTGRLIFRVLLNGQILSEHETKHAAHKDRRQIIDWIFDSYEMG